MFIKKTLLLIIFQLIIFECFASPFDTIILDDSILNAVDENDWDNEVIEEEKTVEIVEEKQLRKYKIFNNAELILLDRLTGQKIVYEQNGNLNIKVEKCYHYDDVNYRNIDFAEVSIDDQKEIISNNNSIKNPTAGEENRYLIFLKRCF